MEKLIRTGLATAAAVFLVALLLRDLSVLHFHDAYVYVTTMALFASYYIVEAVKGWRSEHYRPGFRKTRWIALAITGPILVIVAPTALAVPLVQGQFSGIEYIASVAGLLLVGLALTLYNLLRWNRQSRKCAT